MPEWAGWKRVRCARGLADTGETGSGADPARQLVDEVRQLREGTLTLAFPRFAGEGTGDLRCVDGTSGSRYPSITARSGPHGATNRLS